MDPRDPLPNQEVGRNPPMYRDTGSTAGGVFFGLLVAAIIGLSVLWYATSENTALVSNPPPSTVGQGVPSIPAPPPARLDPTPALTPSPATPTTPSTPGVDAEQSPTMPKQ
jgi:hypothetical protein